MSRPSAPPTPDEAACRGTAGADPSTPPHLLARLLRTHAAGLLADTAAVDLLIAHRYWLTRPAFTTPFVHPVTAADGSAAGARIDWQAAITALAGGELPCSGSQADVLRIAASLGADLPVTLRDVLGRLDDASIAALTTAITAANGTE